jgi:hypothetical protein
MLVCHTFSSDDVPRVFASVAEFAASDTGAKAVIADTDRFVLESVGEIVFAFGHGTNEDADAFRGLKFVDIISDSYHLGVETQSDLSAIWR